MDKHPDLKNIRSLLIEGFSEHKLRELCLYEPDFRPLHNQLPKEAGSDKIVFLIIDHAFRTLKIDLLLEWTKKRNPERFEHHKPYYQVNLAGKTNAKFFFALEENNLGYGITLGGIYQNVPLKLAATDWVEYGIQRKVRSGWLYIPQWTESHAITFFKIHIFENGPENGENYIHLVDTAAPVHTIWLRTQAGDHIEQEFHFGGDIALATDVWHFKWRK
jgi:hypothetical protein